MGQLKFWRWARRTNLPAYAGGFAQDLAPRAWMTSLNPSASRFQD
jgi:hypothetical protein